LRIETRGKRDKISPNQKEKGSKSCLHSPLEKGNRKKGKKTFSSSLTRKALPDVKKKKKKGKRPREGKNKGTYVLYAIGRKKKGGGAPNDSKKRRGVSKKKNRGCCSITNKGGEKRL